MRFSEYVLYYSLFSFHIQYSGCTINILLITLITPSIVYLYSQAYLYNLEYQKVFISQTFWTKLYFSFSVSMKTFMNHVPTGEDISHLMKEFTVDFLLKGYGPLMTELKKVVLNSKDVNLDTSHFTWLIMFFLKFASQLEIDLEKIRSLLWVFLFMTIKSVEQLNQLLNSV